MSREVGGPLGYEYLSFDSDILRSDAAEDPAGFVADLPSRVMLDEVQRVPHLFAALKSAIDRDRRPGLKGIRSVVEIGGAKGDVPLPENTSVDPKNIVAIRAGLAPDEVRVGRF